MIKATRLSFDLYDTGDCKSFGIDFSCKISKSDVLLKQGGVYKILCTYTIYNSIKRGTLLDNLYKISKVYD